VNPPYFRPNSGRLFKKDRGPDENTLPLIRTHEDLRNHFNAWAARRGYPCRLRDGGPLKPLEYYNAETGEVPD